MKLKIFVVNLKRSVERRQIMERQLSRLNLPFEIFEATHGASLKESEILNYYDRDYYANKPAWFTPGMAGCTISHYLLYKKIEDEKIDVALILEDDMQLPKALPSVIEKLSTEIRDDEAILLFYQSYAPINLSEVSARPVVNTYTLYQIIDINRLRSTGGYMITYKTARKMAASLAPFTAFPDDWKGFYERGILNGIRVVHPLLLENTYEPTTISPNKSGGAILTNLVRIIEANKIFPLYQFLQQRRKRNIFKSQRCFILPTPAIDYRKFKQ